MLVLSDLDVRRCLSIKEIIDVNSKALRSIRDNGGEAIVPRRIGLPYRSATACSSEDAEDWTLFKPAYFPASNDEDEEVMGMKLVSIRGNNPTLGLPTVTATTALNNAETGEVEAVVSSTYLTAARTAAGSALATKLVLEGRSPEELAGLTLVVFGAGLQGELHIRAICLLANVIRLVIVNRSKERANKLSAKFLKEGLFSDIHTVELSDEERVRCAVEGAHVIVTATNASTPLFAGSWVRPGCHVNSVGSYTPITREIDDELVKRSHAIVDTHEAINVGDLRWLKNQNDRKCTLLGNLLAGNDVFSEALDETIDCTLYKSVGTAIQDVCSAALAVKAAREKGIGTNVDMS
ncbi:hypothetical protein THAOC_37307 [Thalassiosira oceanica]|uniref:Ornithine cyclodeaminase n=1 Tax=Thalassiosira oceanica TaxID=159749 RepID=K0RCG7_THAOC|nr:hypothetical protein THAOC_37307 [Thalassiosira oceanica]|eukprot:EJK44177.1 hypothetical protein THAOC_37307 [Thalassiosira oceanica]